jgi:hypothetical protein
MNDDEAKALVEEQISEGMAVSDVIKTRGFQVIEKYLKKRKDELLNIFLDRESLPKDTPLRAQELEVRIELYKEIELIIGLPDFLIKRSQSLNDRLNNPPKEEKKFIKTDINDPYI